MSHESSVKSSPKILKYSKNNEIFVGGVLAAPCRQSCMLVCNQQSTVVGRLLTTLGYTVTVAKCCQQQTDDGRLLQALGDGERAVSKFF